jgi:alpha-glucosidase
MPKKPKQSRLSRGQPRARQRLAPQRSTTGASGAEDPWWKHSVTYEIYLRSFQDSDGDGVGDLNGIAQRLDYLESLGVDAIWLTPFYPSPQVDFGYDISDYRVIDPRYGTLEDFGRLVVEAAKRGVRVLLDMVLNHTSDQHAWFLEAASARDCLWHDFYLWSDGRTDASGKRVPPNNWVSLFGGSAWEYVPAVDQFYCHKYYRQQPDLNWRNPNVERAMFESMRFWLERGVAGFRLDAITSLMKDEKLRDEPELGGTNAQGDPNLDHIYTDNLPETHQVIRRLRAMIDTYPGRRVLIGETYLQRTSDLDAWYGGARHNELHLPMDTLVGLGSKLDASTFRQYLTEAATEPRVTTAAGIRQPRPRAQLGSFRRRRAQPGDRAPHRNAAAHLTCGGAAVPGPGDRTADVDAAAGRGCSRPDGCSRLAERQGARRRAYPDAVGRLAPGRL